MSHAAGGALQIWGHGDHQTQAAAEDPISGSVVLLQLRSMLMPMSHVATKSLGSGLQPMALLVSRNHTTARIILI